MSEMALFRKRQEEAAKKQTGEMAPDVDQVNLFYFYIIHYLFTDIFILRYV